MSTTYKAVVQLAAGSALPRDVSENVYFIEWSSGTPAGSDFDAACLAFAHFWNNAATGSVRAMYQYLARDRDYSTNACKTVFYQMPSTPGPTGSPAHSSPFTLLNPGSGTVGLPDQVAVCNSFHASLTGVVTHPGRHRGRVFLGPPLMADLIRSTTLILDTELAAANWNWVVFSRADWIGRTVSGGYVDDRFDTQRRRLERTTGRLTW